ncbi:methionine ABC transporter permease [Allokutzneria albata]|uniref:D-methionine transport system permease protein n=1 Tax=Allokutzneria albata TaxID=211114 RepID=A0A1G9YSY9_ALLAB|nr:methionine ABC transporter permease [Allokutzneria albata]SDN12067.1 D-methionine transport system permease protein [Allokutzneria albata]
MRTETPWSTVFELLAETGWETLYMVALSAVFALIGGLPLGVLLHVTAPGGLRPQVFTHRVLNFVVDVGRSLPFVILLIALLPVTRSIVGTTLGSTAAVVPLTVGAIPFLARLVEGALREVDTSVVEAAITTGATKPHIVRGVLLREAAPALVAGIGVTVIALIGYSAMAGVVGGGGLGDLAIRYGYQRFDTRVLISTVVVLGVFARLVQFLFDLGARGIDRRRRVTA